MSARHALVHYTFIAFAKIPLIPLFAIHNIFKEIENLIYCSSDFRKYGDFDVYNKLYVQTFNYKKMGPNESAALITKLQT
jgi:hypothetical protein